MSNISDPPIFRRTKNTRQKISQFSKANFKVGLYISVCVCLHRCAWNNVCIHVCYMCIFVHIHTCMYVIFMHIYTHTDFHTYIHVRTCTHTWMRACMHVYVYIYINLYMHTYAYMHVHTHMHTYIRLSREVCLCWLGFFVRFCVDVFCLGFFFVWKVLSGVVFVHSPFGQKTP